MNEQIRKLQKIMKDRDLHWFLACNCDPHGSECPGEHHRVIAFLTGFTGENATLLVSRDSAFLWTDGRFFIQAENELGQSGVILMRMGEEGVDSPGAFLSKNAAGTQRIAADILCIPEKKRESLKSLCTGKDLSLVDASPLVDEIWPNRPPLLSHPVLVMDDGIFGGSIACKLEKVRGRMKELGISRLEITALDDVMWLFNITGCDIPFSTLCYSFAVVEEGSAQLFLFDEAVTSQLENILAQNNVALRHYAEFKGSACVQPRIVEELKAVKTEEQLQNIRRYFYFDSAAVVRFIYNLEQKGFEATELSAARMLREERERITGFMGESFPTISAYGKNAAMAHYAPSEGSDARIERCGMYLCDSGGLYPGVTTDVTRTVSCGSVTPSERRCYTLTAAGWARLMNAVWKKGCTGRNLDILAREKLWRFGYDYNHGTGHGVGAGLCVHEGPQSLRWKKSDISPDVPLRAGMLITDEPGCYEEGRFGIRIENTLLVKDAPQEGFLEFEPLTLVPIDTSLIDRTLLWDEEAYMIDSYHALVFERLSRLFTGDILDWLRDKCEKIS